MLLLKRHKILPKYLNYQLLLSHGRIWQCWPLTPLAKFSWGGVAPSGHLSPHHSLWPHQACCIHLRMCLASRTESVWLLYKKVKTKFCISECNRCALRNVELQKMILIVQFPPVGKFEELVYTVWDSGAHVGWPGHYREDLCTGLEVRLHWWCFF